MRPSFSTMVHTTPSGLQATRAAAGRSSPARPNLAVEERAPAFGGGSLASFELREERAGEPHQALAQVAPRNWSPRPMQRLAEITDVVGAHIQVGLSAAEFAL